MKRSELKQIIREVIEESTRTMSTNKNNQFDIDLSDKKVNPKQVIRIEPFYYEDQGFSKEEYVDTIISDLSLDETKSLVITATKTQFEVNGTTKRGQELYINQFAKNMSQLFGGLGDAGLKKPTITLDNVSMLETVKEQFEEYGYDDYEILMFRTDIYTIK